MFVLSAVPPAADPRKPWDLNNKWCRGLNIALCVLPLPGESRQAVAAVVELGAVSTVEAAVVPSHARADGDGELRKPGGRNGTNVSPPLLNPLRVSLVDVLVCHAGALTG